MRHLNRPVLTSLALAFASSWLIGRVCHLLGMRHTGGHVIAEVVVLFALSFTAALALGRSSTVR
jgi:hypothetical protein